MTLRVLRSGRIACAFALAACGAAASAQPTLTVNRLGLRAAATGLVTPIAMAFLGANDFLVLEKQTGKVVRVTNGAPAGVVLDLAVNNASERGLLGIALHPQFAS